MTLSYSALKQFDNCPRQYHEVRVLQKHPRQETEQTIWGKKVHLACEEYIRDGRDFNLDFPGQEGVTALRNLDGAKHCEMELAVNDKLEPVDFNDPTALIRGIADLVIVGKNYLRVIDFKTGSAKYPDTAQLELMALLLFPLFPEAEESLGALIFLAHNRIVSHQTKRSNANDLWVNWFKKIQRIETAHETGVWNPKASGLCPWCPVVSCEHRKEKRR